MSEKDKPKWDGRSRPTNDLYKKNYDEIFKWWYNSDLQKERKNFSNKFARKSNNPFLDIKKISKY